MTRPPAVLDAFTAELRALPWVTDLLVGGSLATGDYVAGVSDLDLVAVSDGSVDDERLAELTALHTAIDAGAGAGQDLGCVYVDSGRLADVDAEHPTWTHGELTRRSLSRIARVELVLDGFAVLGRPPQDVLPPVTADDVRDAARAEVTGYWARAARHPWWFLDPVMPDLGLTSMARGRHALATGELLTKSRAIESADAPAWLREQLRARRRGEQVRSPRVRSAWIAWRDTRRTVARAGRTAAAGDDHRP